MKFLCFMAALFFYISVCFYNKLWVCVTNNFLFIIRSAFVYSDIYFLYYVLYAVNQCIACVGQSIAPMIRIVYAEGVCLYRK